MRETGPRKSELAEMLEERREEFFARWLESFQTRPGPGVVPPTNVLDSLPAFLDDIGELLTEPLEALEASARRLSGAHGRHRYFSGTELQTVVLEYETILEVVVDMVYDYGPKVHLAAWQRLHRWLFSGIKGAVDSYTAARDRQMEEQNHEHLSFLAHELRNPVTSLSLALQILDTRLPDQDRRISEMMKSNLGRIMDLIDRQLVALRLEAGVPMHAERLRVLELLQQAATSLEPNARSRNQTIEIEAESGLSFQGDARLVRSVLANLIGNAIKFSREGAALRVRATRQEDCIAIGVEDECGGLAEETIDRLFEPFVQAAHDRTGHGLGLSIVRQAVEAHNGRLGVRNMPGKGCEIIASFPDTPQETSFSATPSRSARD